MFQSVSPYFNNSQIKARRRRKESVQTYPELNLLEYEYRYILYNHNESIPYISFHMLSTHKEMENNMYGVFI